MSGEPVAPVMHHRRNRFAAHFRATFRIFSRGSACLRDSLR